MQPSPENYLPQTQEETTKITFRIPISLKEKFDRALESKGFSQNDFFNGQVEWFIDFVEHELKGKRQTKKK